MKKFKYTFSVKGKKFEGTLEHQEELHLTTGKPTGYDKAAQILANQYGYSFEEVRKSIRVHKDNSASKSNAADFDKTLIGGAANLVGKGIKRGVDKTAEYNSEEAREMREIKRQQQEEDRAIREAKQKIDDQELADKTMKVYAVLKPYLKFIIPAYLLAFTLTIIFVDNKKIVVIFFSLPIAGLIYLTYNAITNKPK